MGGEGGGPAQGSSDFTHPPSRYLNKHGRKCSVVGSGIAMEALQADLERVASAVSTGDQGSVTLTVELKDSGLQREVTAQRRQLIVATALSALDLDDADVKGKKAIVTFLGDVIGDEVNHLRRTLIRFHTVHDGRTQLRTGASRAGLASPWICRNREQRG